MLRKIFLILLTALPVSCIQTENSNTLDADTYGSGSAVKYIFCQHCTPCHSFQAMSVDDFVNQGLMVKGDPLNSKIYYRLIGSSGSNGPKSMPSSGAALSAGDLAEISDWVTTAN